MRPKNRGSQWWSDWEPGGWGRTQGRGWRTEFLAEWTVCVKGLRWKGTGWFWKQVVTAHLKGPQELVIARLRRHSDPSPNPASLTTLLENLEQRTPCAFVFSKQNGNRDSTDLMGFSWGYHVSKCCLAQREATSSDSHYQTSTFLPSCLTFTPQGQPCF